MLGLQWYIGGLTWMQNSIVESKERDFVTTTTSIFMRERLLGSEKNLNFLVQLLFWMLVGHVLTVRWVQRAWSRKLHRLVQLAFEECIGALMVLQITFIVPPCRTKTRKRRAHLILAVC